MLQKNEKGVFCLWSVLNIDALNFARNIMLPTIKFVTYLNHER